jgi:hypothetical protein
LKILNTYELVLDLKFSITSDRIQSYKKIDSGVNMDNNILISAGILHTYWKQNKRDTLDLLLPFLKCSIAETTKQDDEIKVDALARCFSEVYGYSNVPINVIYVMLKRLSPTVITKKNNKYYFTGNIDKEVAEFYRKKTANKENIEKVIKELSVHLTESFKNRKFTSDDIGNCLYSFFARNGLCLARTIDNLIGLKQKDNPIDYEIARFIMKEYESKSVIFDYIYNMVQGFFVSTAVYLPQTSTSLQAKLHGVSCYIDTRIIINALGMHLPNQVKEGAIEFLEMLKKAGASLYCFQHNYDEIISVLLAYKGSLQNTYYYSSNTLEAFDEMSYSPDDVDVFITRLPKLIEDLGIKIVDAPSYDNSYNDDAYIDFEGLVEKLKQNISYNQKSKDNAAYIDAISAASIMLLRNGYNPKELEKSKCIFISSNNRYCDIVEKFLNPNQNNIVPVAYSEINLAALLWLRNYSAHKDYPKNKLIENAMLILDIPSTQFLNDFLYNIDILQSQGDITPDEAAILRMDSYTRKAMLKETRGDSSCITKDSVLAIMDRLKNKYLAENEAKSNINYEKYIEEKRKHDLAIKKASDEVRKIGNTVFEKEKKKWRKLVNIAFVVLGIIIVICLISSISTENVWTSIISVILLIVEFASIYDFYKSKIIPINKWIDKKAQSVADKAMDKKREEYERLFGSMSDF